MRDYTFPKDLQEAVQDYAEAYCSYITGDGDKEDATKIIDEILGWQATLTHQAWDGPTEQEMDGITPIPITGPGWYKTKTGHRAYIEGCDSAGHAWYGSIEDWGETETWRPNGETHDGYQPWMIVKKEDV